jgi:hypothetical protein
LCFTVSLVYLVIRKKAPVVASQRPQWSLVISRKLVANVHSLATSVEVVIDVALWDFISIIIIYCVGRLTLVQPRKILLQNSHCHLARAT